ncbi:MAG: hypothetical protein J6W89_00275 [Paludibacteraceae bacterium]|nr:hypothetical protein [Paludibacteraceae bacterium]
MEKKSADQLQRDLRILYYTIYACVIAFLGFALWQNSINVPEEGEQGIFAMFDPNEQLGMILQYIVIIYTLCSIPGALFWFKRKCRQLSKIEDDEEKYSQYYQWATLRAGLIALGLVLSCALYVYMNFYNPMLWLAGINAIAFVFTKPTPGKAEAELRPEDENNPTY